jgi:methionyl aminopeptidase
MQQSEVDSYVKAGEMAKEVKEFVVGLVEPGMKLIDIAEAVDGKIVELGGEAAFPVNLSLNEVAAHYTPAPGDETLAEGLLKIDLGVCVDGFIADTAVSIDLTEDKRFTELFELNEEILANVSEMILGSQVDGGRLTVNRVGDVVQDTLEKGDSKFAVIKSLSGHALGKDKIHAGLTISNYRNDNAASLDDSAFAVEPFVTTGVGDIYEGPTGGIYVLQSDGNVRDRDARKILAYIKDTYKTRPFCVRWILKAVDSGRLTVDRLSVARLRLILGGMVKQGILHEYPMLIEKSRAPVSQFENTFVISGDEVFCTTG